MTAFPRAPRSVGSVLAAKFGSCWTYAGDGVTTGRFFDRSALTACAGFGAAATPFAHISPSKVGCNNITVKECVYE